MGDVLLTSLLYSKSSATGRYIARAIKGEGSLGVLPLLNSFSKCLIVQHTEQPSPIQLWLVFSVTKRSPLKAVSIKITHRRNAAILCFLVFNGITLSEYDNQL